MLIKSQEFTVDVPKSAGRMLTLMHEMNLPLTCYKNGRLYTVTPFGPHPGEIYDWQLSSPVRFTQHHVDKAIALGLVHQIDNEVFTTEKGHSLAPECSKIWKFEIDDYFKRYGVDWRTMT